MDWGVNDLWGWLGHRVRPRWFLGWAAWALLVACASHQATMSGHSEIRGWQTYYDRTAERPPWPLLIEALEFFRSEDRWPALAVDAGCGTGIETRFLSSAGIEVLAFDAQPTAIDRLRGALDPMHRQRVRTQVASFHEANWGESVDLAFAGFALPFADPEEFPIAWKKMEASLTSGGRFVGHLFGDRDGWAGQPDLTHHSRAEVEALLARNFEIEVLREVEKDQPTALGTPKHWHFFEIIARKR